MTKMISLCFLKSLKQKKPIHIVIDLIFNGQLIYLCAITPYSNPTKQHVTDTKTHIDSTLIDYSFELE